MLDGRKALLFCLGLYVDGLWEANRGFTISTGTSADPDFSRMALSHVAHGSRGSLRNSKRAQTLPADTSRRALAIFEEENASRKTHI